MMPSMVLSDQELMRLSQEGNHIAFTELYKRYWKKLLAIAWNHTNDKGLAEDIVHEVFLSLWTDKIGVEILNVGGFLATKMKFAIFKNYRKELHRSKLAKLNYSFSDISLDDQELDAFFLKEYIDGIIQNLPEKCKLVFKYSRQSGMNNADIASQMNISEKGVEANLTRALKIIRNNLEATSLILLISQEFLKKYL